MLFRSVTYSLSGADAGKFTIDAATGAVTLKGNPNYEGQSSYSFTVVATDAAGNHSEQAVSLLINNLDLTAPRITSSPTATPLAENSGSNLVVYTVTSDDSPDVGVTTYSLKAAGDHARFSVDPSTGVVTLLDDPDYESKSSYAFTVVATDLAGNASELEVTLSIEIGRAHV